MKLVFARKEKVALCCHDFKNSHVMWHLNEEAAMDFWNG